MLGRSGANLPILAHPQSPFFPWRIAVLIADIRKFHQVSPPSISDIDSPYLLRFYQNSFTGSPADSTRRLDIGRIATLR
ncbi:hypothetical protein Hypma_006455 [Hypsizygus marmoreus]|uniref:Uncharacterized protein n=1 Tax=Hypsizygus marmoreus TaxID=39966 RepID=A0A369JV80_HYPMA|nr:hypothetical protein Hypma_006455 [Hypsizygus marmoreus]